MRFVHHRPGPGGARQRSEGVDHDLFDPGAEDDGPAGLREVGRVHAFARCQIRLGGSEMDLPLLGKHRTVRESADRHVGDLAGGQRRCEVPAGRSVDAVDEEELLTQATPHCLR